jgi:hypothetical protein
MRMLQAICVFNRQNGTVNRSHLVNYQNIYNCMLCAIRYIVSRPKSEDYSYYSYIF